jgi:hypothetical protein
VGTPSSSVRAGVLKENQIPIPMKRKLLLRLISWLYQFTYESVTVDKINKKLIRPVPGVIIDGVQYFEFVQVADMPETRRTHYTYLREEMMMGIDRPTQYKIIEQLKLAISKAEVGRANTILFMWEDMLKNITTVENLYNLASLMYFDDKEDLANYDLDYAQQKIARFKKLPKSFFFIRLLQEGLKISGESLQNDMEQLLRESAVKLRAYNQILSGTPE